MENKNWKNLSVIQTIKSNMGILVGLVILCVVLSFTTSSFATVTNLFNVVRQITINLFLACGMTFVILLAGIDLSVGSVIAVSGCISAGLISWNGLPVYVGILTINPAADFVNRKFRRRNPFICRTGAGPF